MLKHAFYFFLKLLFLYLTLGVYSAMVAVAQLSMVQMIFIAEPFLHVSSAVIIFGALVSLILRSRGPFLWAIFWALFAAALLHLPWTYVGTFISVFLFTGAINYLYRNRFTEPTLVFLPIIAGVLLLLRPLYYFYLRIWAYFETGINSFKDDTLLQLLAEMAVQILFVVPFLVMYILGKHGYVKLFPLFLYLRRGKSVSENSPA